jgi:acetyl esterase/lipase
MRRITLVVALIAVVCLIAIELWPAASAPGPPAPGTIQRNITYCTVNGVQLKMDFYYPQTARVQSAPVAVYVHGGGWSAGDKADGEATTDIPELTAQGYLVAAINYRLAPQYKFPAQIEDVKCAIRSLRAHSAVYHLDPNHVGVWGGSAGGHLVSLLGVADASAGWDVGQYTDQSSRVQAVVDMFGPADLTVPDFNGLHTQLLEQVFGTTDPNSEALKRASPVTWISSGDPPFLILQGEKDNVVPPSQSQEFYDKLKAASVPATLVMVQNAGHGFTPVGGPISPSRSELTKMIADFFDQHLK